MTVGSVRGKERLLTPLRVAQGGRVVSSVGPSGTLERALVTPEEDLELVRARSLGGQVRLNPPFTESVGCPHCAQKGLRAFQSRSWRASA